MQYRLTFASDAGAQDAQPRGESAGRALARVRSDGQGGISSQLAGAGTAGARDEFLKTWGRELPSAQRASRRTSRRASRTTNLLERMFGEERRRTKVIALAFGEKAVMKLMYAALMRGAT